MLETPLEVGELYEIVDFGEDDQFYTERDKWVGIQCKCLDFDRGRSENGFFFGHFQSADFPGSWGFNSGTVCFAYVKLRLVKVSPESYRVGNWLT